MDFCYFWEFPILYYHTVLLGYSLILFLLCLSVTMHFLKNWRSFSIPISFGQLFFWTNYHMALRLLSQGLGRYCCLSISVQTTSQEKPVTQQVFAHLLLKLQLQINMLGFQGRKILGLEILYPLGSHDSFWCVFLQCSLEPFYWYVPVFPMFPYWLMTFGPLIDISQLYHLNYFEMFVWVLECAVEYIFILNTENQMPL